MAFYNRQNYSLASHLGHHRSNSITAMTRRVEEIPQASQAQTEDIRVLLQALESRISGLSNQINVSQRDPQSQPTEDAGNDRAAEKESELLESIGRLRNLVSSKDTIARDEEAQSVINDLGQILKEVSRLSGDGRAFSSKRKAGTIEDNTGGISLPELKRLRRLFTSSHSIQINSGSKAASLIPLDIFLSSYFSTSK